MYANDLSLTYTTKGTLLYLLSEQGGKVKRKESLKCTKSLMIAFSYFNEPCFLRDATNVQK